MTNRDAVGPWTACSGGLVGASLAALLVLSVGTAPAADVAWDNDADPDDNWTTDANWDGDVAPIDDAATDTAVFGVKGVLNDPTLDADRSAAGVNFTDVGWSLNGGSTLTVGAGGIDSAGAGTNAIDGGVSILMADDSTWTTGAGNTLNVGGDVDNGGNTLTLDSDGTTTFDGVISGAGGLDVTGAGDVNLNGVNTYTGPTNISNGTVDIGAAGSIASDVTLSGGTLNVEGAVNGSLTFDNLAGTLTGGGTLNLNADGITSDGAGTNVVPGTLGVTLGAAAEFTAEAGNTLEVAADIDNQGNDVRIGGDGDATFSGEISGAGGLLQYGAGVTNLDGVNTYTGNTVITAGTLNINGSTTSNVTYNGGNLNVDGTLEGAVFVTGVDRAIDGTGTIIVGDNGIQAIAGAASTTTVAGTLDIQLSADSLWGATLNNTLDVDAPIDNAGHLLDVTGGGVTTFDGVISGAGGLTWDDLGVLNLNAVNTYTGPTTLQAGTVNLNGSLAGDVDQTGGTVNVAGTAGGDYDISAGTANVTGTITGDVDQSGGTVNLDAAGGVDGAYAISSGTSNLAGTVAGDVDQTGGTVNLTGMASSDYALSGGVLGGGGTIGGNLTITGGTFAPGSSIDAVDVQGDFTLGSDGRWEVEWDKGAGEVDHVNIGGAGEIGGAPTIRFMQIDMQAPVLGETIAFATAAGGWTLDMGTVVVQATLASPAFGIDISVDGTDLIAMIILDYSGTTSSSVNPGIGLALNSLGTVNPAHPLLAATVDMDADELNQFVSDTDGGGRASAQVPAAAALAGSQSFVGHQTAYLAARRSGAPMLAMYMDPAQSITSPILAAARTDPAVLAAALEQARQGENADGQPARMVDNFPDPFVRRGKLPPSPDQPYGGYVKGVGLLANQDSESGRAGYSLVGGGIQGGVDAQLDEQWIGGLSLGYTNSQVDLSGGLGDIDIHSIRFGPYASYQRDAWFFDGSASFGYHLHEATRTTALGDADADYDAWDATVYGGVGYGIEFGRITLTPTASLQYTYFNREAYTESGPGALSMSEEDTHTLHGRVGGTWSYTYEQMNGVIWVPEFSVGWQHEFLNDDDPIEAAFAGGGAGFSIQNKGAVRDAMYMGGGLSVLLDRSRSLFVRYDGTFSDSHDAHALSVGLTLRF